MKTLFIALALTCAASAGAQAQGRISNAKTETRSAAQGLEREVRTIPEALSSVGLNAIVRAMTVSSESRGPSEAPESDAARTGTMAGVV